MADTCVARVPIFKGLGERAQLDVASYATPRHLERGETLYLQGQHVAQLFVVHTGEVKLTHTRPDGTEQVLRTAGPGDVVGENAFLTGSRPDHSVTALEPLQACVFDHKDLARLTATHPQIAVDMLRELSRRLADTEQHLTEVTSTDVATRVAQYLLNLPAASTNGVVTVTLPLSKREVASYLGTTPESFSRALRRLEDAGSIRVDGADIDLLDFQALEER